MLNGRCPDGAFVGPCPFPTRRIENQINALVLHVVNQIGVTLDDLFDMLDRDVCFFYAFGRARCRQNRVSHFMEIFRNVHCPVFVARTNTDENTA